MIVYVDSITAPTGYCATPQGQYTIPIDDAKQVIVDFNAQFSTPIAGNVAARLAALEAKVGIVPVSPSAVGS